MKILDLDVVVLEENAVIVQRLGMAPRRRGSRLAGAAGGSPTLGDRDRPYLVSLRPAR